MSAAADTSSTASSNSDALMSEAQVSGDDLGTLIVAGVVVGAALLLIGGVLHAQEWRDRRALAGVGQEKAVEQEAECEPKKSPEARSTTFEDYFPDWHPYREDCNCGCCYSERFPDDSSDD